MLCRRCCAVVLLTILAMPSAAGAEDVIKKIYVSPRGDDALSGTLAEPNADKTAGPLRTVAAARDAVRKLKAGGKLTGPLHIVLRGGNYQLNETLVFGPDDSGTAEAPITYAAQPGENVVLSGGVAITGWKREGDGPLWTTTVAGVKEGNWYPRSLFVDGRRCIPARTPNEGEVFEPVGPLEPLKDREAARRDPGTRLGFIYREGDLTSWADLDDAVLVYYHSWTTSRHGIQRLDTEKKAVHFTNRSGWPIGWWAGKERYYVENVREALDAPGEFYLDRKSGLLTYYPRPGEEMTKVETVAPRLGVLVRLQGDAENGKAVDHLRFENLSFFYTDWEMQRDETMDGQAAAFLPDATVYATMARHCALVRCEIAHTGGYGLWFAGGSKDCLAEQCEIHDLGGGGVRLGETELPKEPEKQAERNSVLNCFIHSGSRVFHAGIGVWIGRSSYNKVMHNEICDFYYSGVSVGWSWGYAPSTAHHNEISFNHIHHLGYGQLSDLGGIYCLGISPGTRLTDNLIHDVSCVLYGGWGLYTDEGSTGILMENNIVYRVQDGAFHQHYGRDNIVRNNIFSFSAELGQIRRSRQEEHNSFTIDRNIVYATPAQPLGGNWSNGNYRLDHNLYFRPEGDLQFPGKLTFSQWQGKGSDEHSIAADPKFVDVASFDFSLLPDSPAFKVGFRPIDTSQIGLTGPGSWRELPKKLMLPKLRLPGEEK
ncbi:MAG: right-handed parallel beta-helix repeat-containing protein [Rhodopirellula sp.]|nr:right-handed parallel beta-helix repeat-containing protein [Rhodopirellula sp.]